MRNVELVEYNKFAKFLHWLIGGLLILEWLIGASLDMTEFYTLHFQVGSLILVLVAIRLIWRIVTPQPPVEPTLSKLNQLAVAMGHGALYLLMFVVPLLGLALVFTHGEPITLLGIHFPALVASPWPHDTRHLIKEIHSLCAATLICLGLLHGVIAVVHYILHKNILPRMLPRFVMTLIEKK